VWFLACWCLFYNDGSTSPHSLFCGEWGGDEPETRKFTIAQGTINLSFNFNGVVVRSIEDEVFVPPAIYIINIILQCILLC